jgi:SAM-dependent methyltransferase
MDKNLLVKIIGFPATLIHGDTCVLDRWRWLKERLPETKEPIKLIDIGCGTGAFTIGLARRGYQTLGLSWDERNQNEAQVRAQLCSAPLAKFDIQDVRTLDVRKEYYGQFDIAICLECIEHILNDQKLITDIAACLKPGGKLLLTTPNFDYIPIDKDDEGPFHTTETGWHVRKGYTKADFQRLCNNAGLAIQEVSYTSGYASQKISGVWRKLNNVNPLVSFALTLPLRLIPLTSQPTLDDKGYPGYSICMVAVKK